MATPLVAGQFSHAQEPTVPPTVQGVVRSAADPDLITPGEKRGGTLSALELETAKTLCNLIIPADQVSPGAGDIGVHLFIDEWVSQDYPDHIADRQTIRGGLGWIQSEARSRFGANFSSISPIQHAAICDEICLIGDAIPAKVAAAEFFARFRELTLSGFYTTAEGRKDLGYVGNVALPEFPGPPPQVLRHLGLD